MSGEQKIRAFLFYLSVSIFFTGLPFILSFSLGYKFNLHTFKFAKAGLIALKTEPQGASIYLNNILLSEKTPFTINELLPGKYNLRLQLQEHYPWVREVSVEAGKVTRLEKIILFPLRPSIKHLNKEKASLFWVDSEKERIYYIDEEEKNIYTSDLDGENFKGIGMLPEAKLTFKKCKTSLDRKKLMCITANKITIAYLGPQEEGFLPQSPVVLDSSGRRIIDAFWHSDSYHIILITDKAIEVIEASVKSKSVNLVTLNKRNSYGFYDTNRDILYFADSQKASDGNFYDNIYKLEVGIKALPLRELISPKPAESD